MYCFFLRTKLIYLVHREKVVWMFKRRSILQKIRHTQSNLLFLENSQKTLNPIKVGLEAREYRNLLHDLLIAYRDRIYNEEKMIVQLDGFLSLLYAKTKATKPELHSYLSLLEQITQPVPTT